MIITLIVIIVVMFIFTVHLISVNNKLETDLEKFMLTDSTIRKNAVLKANHELNAILVKKLFTNDGVSAKDYHHIMTQHNKIFNKLYQDV